VGNEQAPLSIKGKAILFDMDGTLVDSTRCAKSIWSQCGPTSGTNLIFLTDFSSN
jgi:beta-phosphoglucomutase-like phosphatase (HAD superfamily)